MKYLISHDTQFVNLHQSEEWGVNCILSIDHVLKSDFSNLPQDKDSLVFFVPTVLDTRNSLSYTGADLALRIMMHYLRIGRTDVDIVVLGNEAELNFALHYNYPNLLKIPGFHYARFNKKTVAQYQLPKRDLKDADEYKFYLDNLGLKIPSSFKSTHSLTNEWCLFKWNSFMGYKENTSALDGHLYFDYLITLERLSRVKNKGASENLQERIHKLPCMRILLIDDNKGWHDFFRKMLQDSHDVTLHCLGENFNKLEFADIGRQIVDTITEFDPHVIILDFRLMEDKDAEIKDNMKHISGYKILAEMLKGTYNRPMKSFGRQVIIFTATSRIENILMLRDANADGFILKEKPEKYNGKEFTKNVISKMVSALDNASERANFLIPLNEELNTLSDIIISLGDPTSDLGVTIDTVCKCVRQLTQNNVINEDILKVVYLNLYFILESLNGFKPNNLDYFVKSEGAGLRLDLWDDMREIRNSIAHGDSIIEKGSFKDKYLSKEILLDWTNNLATFIVEFVKRHLDNTKHSR